MTSDELDKKIIEIKKRGLNNFVENELIADLRKDYYTKTIDKKITNLSQRFRQNVQFLNKIHKQGCSAQKMNEFMGMDMPNEFNRVLYEDGKLYSLRYAIIVAEFFGLPFELLLYHDLEANENTLKTQYPALFRQSRN